MADFLGNEIGRVMGADSGFTNFTLDQTTDQFEVIFQAWDAITLARLGFRYGARTGTPATLKISLQGVNSSGNPDGTIKGGGSPASTTFTPPADTTWDGLYKWFTLDNTYVTTRGELLALVVAYDSGTINGSNGSSISRVIGGSGATSDALVFPYSISNNAGSRSKTGNGIVPFGYGSAGTAYGFPLQAVTTTNFNSGSTPDEYAMAFTLPSGWGSTYTLRGVRLASPTVALTRTAKLILYSGTSVLQTFTYTSDYSGANGGLDQIFWTDSTLTTLNFGTQYRIALQPQATDNWQWYSLTFANANDLAALPGGTNFYESTRTDAGAWSDNTVKRPVMQLIPGDWSFSGGGGGGGILINPGMSGGMGG